MLAQTDTCTEGAYFNEIGVLNSDSKQIINRIVVTAGLILGDLNTSAMCTMRSLRMLGL